jgi:hypothetical protein
MHVGRYGKVSATHIASTLTEHSQFQFVDSLQQERISWLIKGLKVARDDLSKDRENAKMLTALSIH